MTYRETPPYKHFPEMQFVTYTMKGTLSRPKSKDTVAEDITLLQSEWCIWLSSISVSTACSQVSQYYHFLHNFNSFTANIYTTHLPLQTVHFILEKKK
jgi:hypothetical protein